MTTQTVIILGLIALVYLIWIFNLTRRGKMYVGYAVVWLVWSLLGFLIVMLPALLQLVTQVIGTLVPANALTVLGFALLFAMQIYLLSQLSILSRRITLIAQYVAIEKADQPSGQEKH